MGFLQNTWIRYVDRSYQQIKDRVLTQLQARVPEMTDHTESNLFVKIIGIWAGIAEMLGYYIDNNAREAHLDSARLYSSGISHARRADYRVRGKQAATTVLTFYLDSVSTVSTPVPQGTVVQSEEGVQYVTTENVAIPAGQLTVDVPAVQSLSTIGSLSTITNGEPNQEIVIGTDVKDNSVEVIIGGITWERVDSFGFSVPTSKHYINTVNKNKENVIIFGDGINGLIPDSGSSLSLRYEVTQGEDGNAEVGEIATVVNGTSAKVINNVKAVGGSDVESLEQIKKRVPIFNRTLDRAVTRQDYIDLTEIASGVSKAGVSYDGGRTVDVYIVPEGGGVASPILLDSVQAYLDDRKMITTNVVVKSAGENRVRMDVEINVRSGYSTGPVRDRVRDAILNLFSYANQEVQGTLYVSDIYEVIERVEGVKNSVIQKLTLTPYARPVPNNKVLNWSSDIKETSVSNALYRVVFISPTKYQLMREGVFLGERNTGEVIDTEDLTFSIEGSYAVGDSWEFYSYPYVGSTVKLLDPSIPALYEADLNLTMKGGL